MRTQPPTADLSADELQRSWSDLAANDASAAARAIWKLAGGPGQSVPFLQKLLQPVAPISPERLAQLVADLDNELFTSRDAATKELARLGEFAAPALRDALEKAPSAEAGRRIKQLLARLEMIDASAETLRQGRAIEVLEHIATPEARQLLQTIAEGAAGAGLTREAKAALERLGHR